MLDFMLIMLAFDTPKHLFIQINGNETAKIALRLLTIDQK